MDPACNDQPCNNHDGCQINDTCVNGACVGTDFNPCVDLIANECVVTECHPTPGDDSDFYCTVVLDTSKTLFGSCTPDDACGARNSDGTCSDIESTCLAGQCVQEEICPTDEDNPAITCEGQNRNSIPVGICSGGTLYGNICTDIVNSTDCSVCRSGSNKNQPCTVNLDCPESACVLGTCVAQGTENQPGCLDDANPCTADSCIEGVGCEYEILDGAVCRADETSCVFGTCDVGVCTGSLGAVANTTPCNDLDDCTNTDVCTAGTCAGTLTNSCFADEGCQTGHCVGFCVGGSNNGDPCYSGADCFGGGTCNKGTAMAPAGFCSCDGLNPCSTGTCITGLCETDTRTSGPCVVDGCTIGTCNGDNVCEGSLEDSACAGCDNFNACTEPLCTDIGCESTLIQGPFPCKILIPGTGPNTGVCDGAISCNMGLTVGTCVAGTTIGSPCADAVDCVGGGVGSCVFSGTCTNPANAGNSCLSDTDCSSVAGACQHLSCQGGTNDGHACTANTDCTGGGLCVHGCVEVQPPSCTPVGL